MNLYSIMLVYLRIRSHCSIGSQRLISTVIPTHPTDGMASSKMSTYMYVVHRQLRTYTCTWSCYGICTPATSIIPITIYLTSFPL